MAMARRCRKTSDVWPNRIVERFSSTELIKNLLGLRLLFLSFHLPHFHNGQLTATLDEQTETYIHCYQRAQSSADIHFSPDIGSGCRAFPINTDSYLQVSSFISSWLWEGSSGTRSGPVPPRQRRFPFTILYRFVHHFCYLFTWEKVCRVGGVSCPVQTERG